MLAITVAPQIAKAVPSFARQTGMACEACHMVFPELTHFGRMFKANGYTLDNLQQVEGINSEKEQTLSLAKMPPLSVMAQVSYTSTAKSVPDANGTGRGQNGTVAFPQQFSFFYAGKIAPGLGAFIQLSYDNGAGTIGMDNADLRYASHAFTSPDGDLIYGLTLNNNPTVQDLWNSTPAFGFPFVSSNANLDPLAATQIDGTLGQNVAGFGGYLFWKEFLYVEGSAYHSAQQGFNNSVTGKSGPLDSTAPPTLQGLAPYWRVALEHQWGRHALEVGTYGTIVNIYPANGQTLAGPTNEYTDLAADFQYQFLGDNHLFSFTGTAIMESMNLHASQQIGQASRQFNDLTTLRVWATYYYKRKYGGTFGLFSTKGSTDNLLYAACTPGSVPPNIACSRDGSPDTDGIIVEINYVPWLNTKFSLQYTHFSMFNGATNNYDGNGRSAADNDTLYVLGWFAY